MATLSEIREQRLKKLDRLKAAGMDPYPVTTRRDLSLGQVNRDFEKLTEAEASHTLVGRVRSIRGQGGILFIGLDDGTGGFQGLFRRDVIENMQAPDEDSPEESLFTLFAETVDIGDFVELSGMLTTTKRGEPSIDTHTWRMLSKSLRPLPEKWEGLKDSEERSRRRYLDLLASSETRERFLVRSKVIKGIRNFLDEADFLEVETPILQTLAGGATAKPFETYHEALDLDMHLRIALELHHKRLLVGGMPKIYEIGKNFRNEGIDATHNPEFTMLEYYEAFTDATQQQDFVEAMIRQLVRGLFEKTQIELSGVSVDFSSSFERITFFDLLRRHGGIDDPDSLTEEEARERAEELNIALDGTESLEELVDKIYKKTCRPNLIQPTFITDYPTAFSPFAKTKDYDPNTIDRFQLVTGGYELVNAFSELNDPLEQRRRYEEQDEKRRGGNAEISPSDQEFLEAMEYGMPPAGGVGLGIDRLVMLLTETDNIRDVILFPTLRPKDD